MTPYFTVIRHGRRAGSGTIWRGGQRARAISFLVLGFFFLIVPVLAISDVGHVPGRIGFYVGRMRGCYWSSQVLHKTMGMAFLKNIQIANSAENYWPLKINSEPFNGVALSAGTNLIPKPNPSVTGSIRQIGYFISAAPSVAVFDNFPFRFPVIVDVELEPTVQFHFGDSNSIWKFLDASGWFLLRAAASGHVSALNVFGTIKLFLSDAFGAFYQGAGCVVKKVGCDSDNNGKCSNEQSADRGNLFTIAMDESADLDDADAQRRFKGGIIVLLDACCALTLSILLLGLFNRRISKPRRGADNKNNSN
jgi:hypothetical protein